jgi:hypothetical protein
MALEWGGTLGHGCSPLDEGTADISPNPVKSQICAEYWMREGMACEACRSRCAARSSASAIERAVRQPVACANSMLATLLSLNQHKDADNDQDSRPPLRKKRPKSRYPSQIRQQKENPQNNQNQRAKSGFGSHTVSLHLYCRVQFDMIDRRQLAGACRSVKGLSVMLNPH